MNVKQLTKENFVKWGQFISADNIENQGDYGDFKYTGNVAVLELWPATSASILEPIKRDIRLECLEAHKNTIEICVAIKNDCVIFVAEDKNDEPDPASVEAFYLKDGDTVVYGKGVWHWIPFAVNTPSCKQLIVYKDKTGDNDFYKFELKTPISIEM